MRALSKAELSCVAGAGASHSAAASDYARDVSDALTSEKAQSVYGFSSVKISVSLRVRF